MFFMLFKCFFVQFFLTVKKVKLLTVVKGDQKAPFSIATTPGCRGVRYFFPWIAPFSPWYVPYIAECKARRYQVPFLKSLVLHDLRLNPDLKDDWQTLYSLGYLHFRDYLCYSNTFFIKIHPNMSEQEKKRQWIYELHNAETELKKLLINCYWGAME